MIRTLQFWLNFQWFLTWLILNFISIAVFIDRYEVKYFANMQIHANFLFALLLFLVWFLRTYWFVWRTHIFPKLTHFDCSTDVIGDFVNLIRYEWKCDSLFLKIIWFPHPQIGLCSFRRNMWRIIVHSVYELYFNKFNSSITQFINCIKYWGFYDWTYGYLMLRILI